MAPTEKDVNIHVRAKETEQTKQALAQVAAQTQKMGLDTTQAHDRAGHAVQNHADKTSRLDSIISSVGGGVAKMVASFFGMSAVLGTLDRVATKFKEIESESGVWAPYAAGQSLENQTGTVGQQKQWSQFALNLQKAGGLQNIATATQMGISADIALGSSGGIKNPEVQKLLMELAPFVGANQIGPEEVTKLFNFANIAKVKPTAEGYKDYFAKLRAGFASSKATSFGEFMVGLQKGATGYLAGGGSLESGIGMFAASTSVMANADLAATLMEQMARLSEGAYEKPREQLEKYAGVKWASINSDQRSDVLLKYVKSLPPERRIEMLTSQGFPADLATGAAKLVSPEAISTMAAAKANVASASSTQVDDQAKAYLSSMAAKERSVEAGSAMGDFQLPEPVQAWQLRMKEAKSKFEHLKASRKDSAWYPDEIEPLAIALHGMVGDIEGLMAPLPEDSPQRAELADTKKTLEARLVMLKRPNTSIPYMGELSAARGTAEGMNAQQVIINNTYSNDMVYHPAVGTDDRGGRSDPNNL